MSTAIRRLGSAQLLSALAMMAANAAGTIQFSDRSLEIYEDSFTTRFAVIRTGDATGPATVVMENDSTVGTATPNVDFGLSLPATLTFQSGEMAKVIQVSARPDTAVEGTEYMELVLTAVTGATLGAASRIRLDIRDGDAVNAATFDLTARTLRVAEGDTVAVPVAHSTSEAGTVEVSAVFGTATLGSDYTDPRATVDFPAGVQQQTLSLLTIEDALNEGDETIELFLSRPTPQGSVVRGLVTSVVIEDDEPGHAGEFRIEGVSGPGPIMIAENAGSVPLIVRRARGASGLATVDYVTVPGKPRPEHGRARPGRRRLCAGNGNVELPGRRRRATFPSAASRRSADGYSRARRFSRGVGESERGSHGRVCCRLCRRPHLHRRTSFHGCRRWRRLRFIATAAYGSYCIRA